uniref:Bradykinin-potentiating peptide n=1 Tax=Tityus discrepans TaxID=57059 RepID=NDB2_TITDI|nr:RecName: Full=Bradykinin-potentiating peptide; Short=BPP; Short=TdBPP; Flags: Precursor [Tityus discrepans]CAY61908.1 BPP precursor [Tityus discrepans]
MNKKTLLVIFIVTLLIADEVNSFKFGGFLKKMWKSKLAKKLRAKGKQMLKEYANKVLSPEEEAPAAVPAGAPERRRR